MKLKLIACFLFTLFTVVIAFPGYGTAAASDKKNRTSHSRIQTPEAPTWKHIFQKCLSKGISGIEEQRSVEEDEVSESGLIFFHCTIHPVSLSCSLHIRMHTVHHWFEGNDAISKIYSPPEQA